MFFVSSSRFQTQLRIEELLPGSLSVLCSFSCTCLFAMLSTKTSYTKPSVCFPKSHLAASSLRTFQYWCRDSDGFCFRDKKYVCPLFYFIVLGSIHCIIEQIVAIESVECFIEEICPLAFFASFSQRNV